MIDCIQTMVEKTKDNLDIHPVVRYAVSSATKVVNKYYAKTDETDVYRVAMSKSVSLASFG